MTITIEWGSILPVFTQNTTFPYLDCQLFLNIFAGFTHSELVEYEGKAYHKGELQSSCH